MDRLSPLKESLYLNEFQFAQCKKILANKRNLLFNVTSDDMFPILKYHDEIEIAPLPETIKKFQILTFFHQDKVEYALFLQQNQEEFELLKTRDHKRLNIKSYHILGVAKNRSVGIIQKLKLYLK